MTSSIHTEHPPLINLVVSTRLAIYNSKSSKPNRSASPFRKEDLATFKSFYPASSMARSSAHCSPRQNLYDGEDELAGGTSSKGSNRCTPALAAIRASTPAIAPEVALLVASGSANSFVVKYSNDDVQRIFRTVLDSRPPAPVPVPIDAAAPQYKGLCERLLKA